MTLREITIGRSKNSDIYLDDRCIYAGNNHGSIYCDGNQLMYRDNSRNGTMVNNIMVKRRAVPIRHGDTIMIAGLYQVNWNQIDAFFPPTWNAQPMNAAPQMPPPIQQAVGVVQERTPDLSKWNWGAFMLYPIWGFFNGCWWAFLVALAFGWTIIPAVIFGVYGTRWAWENRSWVSVEDFEQTQKSWATWGIALFCVSLFFTFFWLFVVLVIAVS